jgi:hypothetical protein
MNAWDGTNLPDSGRAYAVLGEGIYNKDFAMWDSTNRVWTTINANSLADLLLIAAADIPDSVLFKNDTTKVRAFSDLKYVNKASNVYSWLTSSWLNYSSSSIFKLGLPNRQWFFNNGAYSDFWIGGFVIPPYNLPYNYNTSYEYRTDYYNDTLKFYRNNYLEMNFGGSGTTVWNQAYKPSFINQAMNMKFGNLPDSVGLNWTWQDVAASHVQIGDEYNKTAVPTRFPMPVYGYRFRFTGTTSTYYTYPYLYGFYSDFSTYGGTSKIEKGYHFYGKGDFPSYFGGDLQVAGEITSGINITYPDANTIAFGGDAISLDPTTLEINGSNKLTVVGSIQSNFFTGEDSIHYGQDSIVITHGVGSTPQFVCIQEMSDNFGYRIWVNVIGATTFSVKRNDPTSIENPTTFIKFKWMAYK